MQKIYLVLPLVLLAGCVTTGSGNVHTSNAAISTVLFDKPNGTTVPLVNSSVVYTDISEKPLSNQDIRAINATIAAGHEQYWAPQEEVLQQEMSQDI